MLPLDWFERLRTQALRLLAKVDPALLERLCGGGVHGELPNQFLQLFTRHMQSNSKAQSLATRRAHQLPVRRVRTQHLTMVKSCGPCGMVGGGGSRHEAHLARSAHIIALVPDPLRPCHGAGARASGPETPALAPADLLVGPDSVLGRLRPKSGSKAEEHSV